MPRSIPISFFQGFVFPNPHAGHPITPLPGQPTGNHIGYWPIRKFNYEKVPPLGSYTTMAPSPFDWAPSTNPNPPQIPTPTPIPHQRNASAKNTLSLNAQGPIGLTFPQAPPPVTFSEVPLFPQQPR